jgi:hypothetical protein
MATNTIFGAFKPLTPQTRAGLIAYNLSGNVDGIAVSLSKEYISLVPAAEVDKLKDTKNTNVLDKAKVLVWLESLIPAAKRKPGDNWKAMFVKEFTRKWVTDKYPASANLAETLANLCTTNRSNAANYYDQTLMIDVDASSPFKNEYDTSVKRAWSGVEKIGWRGDDRTPETIVGANFNGTGFEPRKKTSAPIWRTDESKLDVDCDTTICVAVDIRGCAFFPLSKPVRNTWVYCVILSEGWNTHYLQQKVATQKNLSPGTKDFNDKVWLFNERCVSQAKPTEIACAVQLERDIRDGKDPLSGVRFRLGEVRRYPAFNMLTTPMLIKLQNDLAKYARMYPANPKKWLTYQGEVD